VARAKTNDPRTERIADLKPGQYADGSPLHDVQYPMVATSDPQLRQSLNTLVGCAIGMVFLALGHTDWQLPTALALAVLVSVYAAVRVPTMWRQAPITAAILVRELGADLVEGQHLDACRLDQGQRLPRRVLDDAQVPRPWQRLALGLEDPDQAGGGALAAL
jgi:hypothetical protein